MRIWTLLAGAVVLSAALGSIVWYGVRLGDPAAAFESPTSPPAVSPARGRPADDITTPNAARSLHLPLTFLDVAEIMGAGFAFHSDFRADRFLLPEIMGGGVAWFDFDLDGWQDLYLVGGNRLPPDQPSNEFSGQLFRNRAGTAFVNVSEPSGISSAFYGQGCAVGDFDNDGFVDLYVSGFDAAALFQNHGDGTFLEVAPVVGVLPRGWGSSAAFGDLDRDGDLDLYVSHYVVTSLATNPTCTYREKKGMVRGYCGPAHYQGAPDVLWVNQGNGRFIDMTHSAGCAVSPGKGLAVAIADLTNDGWPDIYVANDMMANYLFVNRAGAAEPDGDSVAASPQFEECAMSHGAALLGDGQPGASMGIACGDWNGDGWLDLYVTHYLREYNALYENRAGRFTDVTGLARLGAPTLPYLAFGTGFLDADNDGWLDLFVTNGHVLGPFVAPAAMRAQLFRNASGKGFDEATDTAGPYFYEEHLGRGAAIADFDNDGGTDAIVTHLDEPAALLHNQTAPRGGFVGLELVGVLSNRCAVNARVTAEIGTNRLLREVASGGSYLSDSDRRIHLGIGAAPGVDRLEIRWPSGKVDRYERLPCGRYTIVVEGRH